MLNKEQKLARVLAKLDFGRRSQTSAETIWRGMTSDLQDLYMVQAQWVLDQMKEKGAKTKNDQEEKV